MNTQFPPQPNSPHPFLETLQEEMERLIDRLRFNPELGDRSFRLGASGQMVPAIDVSESDDALDVIAEVPGVDKDDITVTIDKDQLILQGQKRDEREEGQGSYRLSERSYGTFHRTIPLGFVPGDDGVKAVFENGVLRLTIRKPAGASPTARRIEITTA
ncbi:Hsp20/alpha crystallin family protein [Yoonia sp.]|jgi:HSP20 family protein|uniref:Hsp20/alpha crystallin family protein n=1 Tax=Yoonia sp. TaxID=2212373 RepID=UPI003F6D15E4